MEVSKLLPEVYYKESRDFSYVGRVCEVIFNYMKTGADLVKVNPDNENVSDDLLELVCSTVGFESKHKYTKRDLVYIVSDFVNLCRHKGSEGAILEAIRLLINSQEITAKITENNIYCDKDDPHQLIISIPYRMTDIILLEDIFDYILPTGTTYKIIYVYDSTEVSTSKITQSDEIVVGKSPDDAKLGQISNDDNISESPSEIVNRSTFYTGLVASENRGE